MHLRDINKKLSDFLEQHKVVLGQSKRYPEFKDKSEEQQIPTLIHEIENNEQILSLKTIEYKKLKERLDLIKQPSYMLDIEERIEETNKKIDATRKAISKLTLSTLAGGKDLNIIEQSDGIPPDMKNANEKNQEIEILKRKVEKLRARNQENKREQSEKSNKISQLDT